MSNTFTYEHWEAHDEYIILGLGGPIGYTVSKKDVEVITRWLNVALPELRSRIIEDSCDGMEDFKD